MGLQQRGECAHGSVHGSVHTGVCTVPGSTGRAGDTGFSTGSPGASVLARLLLLMGLGQFC